VVALIGFMFDISERKQAEEELLRLHAELEQLSLTDGLTGIANRRLFDQRLESEWIVSQRNDKPLSLIVLDLDYFKQYNDVHGHVAGDECLKRIATVLRDIARRPRDVVARFGGEEFVLLLPETDKDGARAMAQQCVSAIAELRMLHGASSVSEYVTASLGFGTAAAATGRYGTARSFVDAVDRELYAAKRQGRNRIEELAPEPH